MIDRAARDELTALVEAFLDDRLSAFEFDDQAFKLADSTDDTTVQHIVSQLWFHYDDCKNHKVALKKTEWDFLQRMQLVLKSDAVISESTRRSWRMEQTLAATALAGFLAIACLVGFGSHLFLIALPFGLVSMFIARRARARASQRLDQDAVNRLTPFRTTAEIVAVRRTVPAFRKQRFRRELDQRQIRSPRAERYLQIQFHILWLLFSPIALFFQAIPNVEGELSVSLPTSSLAA